MISASRPGTTSDSGLPAPEVREEITACLSDLVSALEAHPSWTPPSPPRGLFHVWDFVCRSRYIMTELDNIYAGRPTKHPEQIPKHDRATSGPQAAALSFHDVLTRTITIDEMIHNPRMLVMLGLSNIDFGDNVRDKSRALKEALAKAR
ncbi:uncharacterized protein NECHADRAFT_102771 [Fusarium vanettenii 77-13-4]|uniref:Uncharacterized protein n=1 Tax=Fusarium vanettenii (strain ATCC MYA-4622 / CBS 123669 / FGSC 9596 / NRRL 45880 / 77-13-4) TaxID=660122 RepID=C7YYL4_FUSV7|nr:uncharacterized protein NECHADRAFT_102771 [Fusarium vanettenii 77-13-4]EEU43209.1 hypothetical protein NECHADRAFT_102771 [Fusarium vanettenii 77-13-4]